VMSTSNDNSRILASYGMNRREKNNFAA